MSRLAVGLPRVLAAARKRPDDVAVVYVDARERERAKRDLEPLITRGVKLEERSESELTRMAGEPTKIVAIVGEYRYVELEHILVEAPSRALLVVLDEVTDPHNFGAIVRSAVAFGADGIITLRERAAPVTKVVVRASAGATEFAKIAKVTNIARTLQMLRKDHGYSVVGLAGDGAQSIDSVPAAALGEVLVVGSEGRGMRRLVRESCDIVARIPMRGPTESLNASVAAAVALYERSRARMLAGS